MFTGRLAQTTHPYPTWSLAIQQAATQFFGEYGGRTARPAVSLGSQLQQGLLDDLGQRRVDVEDSTAAFAGRRGHVRRHRWR
jgi:hypothetical protein